MKDDVRKYIYSTIAIFLTGLIVWISFIYISACGISVKCNSGKLPVYRTPIPTLIPATMPAPQSAAAGMAAAPEMAAACRVRALSLLGAWVSAKAPETEPFHFVDADGSNCEATFAEVQPLFEEGNTWQANSLACVSCHSSDMAVSPAQLDLSSYAGILAGSRRESGKPKGVDILGKGEWETSLLHEFLLVGKAGVPGHEQGVNPETLILAGKPFGGMISTTH